MLTFWSKDYTIHTFANVTATSQMYDAVTLTQKYKNKYNFRDLHPCIRINTKSWNEWDSRSFIIYILYFVISCCLDVQHTPPYGSKRAIATKVTVTLWTLICWEEPHFTHSRDFTFNINFTKLHLKCEAKAPNQGPQFIWYPTKVIVAWLTAGFQDRRFFWWVPNILDH